MSLLTPLALLGLLTLPVIIVLHLLRARREPLLISTLRLWQGLEQKRQGALPRYIPLSLMLVLQLCLAAALTLGLTRPAFSFLLRRPQHTIFILDTTTSMFTEDAGQLARTRRFDVARQTIQTHLQNMDDNDTFVVISLNRHPEILLTGEGSQKTQALLALDDLAPGATGANLSTALTLANGLIEPDRQNQIITLTDGNYRVEVDTLPAMPIPVTWEFIPAQVQSSNQALLDVSAQSWPDNRHQLFARVVNYGDASVVRTLRLSVNGTVLRESTVELEPRTEVARAWTLAASAQSAAVEIVEPDAFPLDNRAELLLGARTRFQVLLISDAPEPETGTLARAFEAQPGLELTIVDSATMSSYHPLDFDLTIFDGLPLTLTGWPDGNLLVVNPPLGHPLLPAENFVRDLRPDPATASALFTGIDLSGVYFDRASHLALPDWAEVDLMSTLLANEGTGPQITEMAGAHHPLVFHGSVGDSRLVVWAFDLAASNLAARLALPLLTANTLSTILSALPPPAVPLGEPVLIDRRLSVETPDGRRLSLPSAQTGEEETSVFSHTKQPGLYKVYNENDKLVGGFAVHGGSALESDLTTRFEPEVLNVDSSTTTILPETEFYEFWPWLAGLALFIVAVEGWLAWRK